jgi:predicted permease
MRPEHWLFTIPLRVRSLFRRKQADQELEDELRDHVEGKTEEYVAKGLAPEDARRQALIEMGGIEKRKEECRDVRRVRWLQDLGRDLRFAARTLRKSPGFTVVAVLTLALGIGANTAIFQLVDAVRLRSLPVKNPQELASIRMEDTSDRWGNFPSPYSDITNPQWEQIRGRQQAFSSIFAWSPDRLNLAHGGEARRAEVIWVSGEFFPTLGVNPFLGRLLNPADDHRGCGTPAAVISYAFWQREYGGERSVLDRMVTLEGHPFPVVGITPPDFFGVEIGHRFDVAIPICSDATVRGDDSILDVRDDYRFAAVGRLKPGSTLSRATKQLETISPAIQHETVELAYGPDIVKHYLANKFAAFPADAGFSQLRSDYETPLWLLLAIAGVVLVIACANLANLTLARATTREKEMAVRLSVGATRGRLIRQLLVEGFLLAAFGAALGALLAGGLSRFLVVYLTTTDNPIFVDLGMDWSVLGFTAGLAALTTVLFGLAPAIRATGVAPGAVLKTAGRGVTAARERFGLRRILIVSQVALSLTLVIGALLFVRSLRNLVTLDAGFQRDGILIVDIDFTSLHFASGQRLSFTKDVLDHLAAIPGVDSVATAGVVPLSGYNRSNAALSADPPQKNLGGTKLNDISPGYFRTLQTPILMGRDFDEHDSINTPLVAIVNEAFVERYLGPASPIGQRFAIGPLTGKPRPVYTVVGVVKNTKYRDLHEDLGPIAYLAGFQDKSWDQNAHTLIRSNLPLSQLLSAVQQTFAAVNPLIETEFHTLNTNIEVSLLRDRLMATLSGFFGILAGMLAATGLYGVISYSVERRRNEIGIRMALGASRPAILGLVMREAGLLLAIGAVVGSGLALALGRTASSMLYGLRAYDPITIFLAIGALTLITALASYLPAYRASRVDPITALRDE